MWIRIGAVLLAIGAQPVYGDVADASASGFTLKIAVTIDAPPGAVYRKLVHNVGEWWSSRYAFSGDSRFQVTSRKVSTKRAPLARERLSTTAATNLPPSAAIRINSAPIDD